MKSVLRNVISDQKRQLEQLNIQKRDFPETMLSNKEIIIISGIRRCGKSMLMEQIRRMQAEKDFFINLDDKRLINFKTEHFQLLHEVFIGCMANNKCFISMKFKMYKDGNVLYVDCMMSDVRYI